MSIQDAQRALAMIKRAKAKGRASDVSITRETEGGYNPVTGGFDDPTAQIFTGIGVKIGYEQSDIDGTLIRQGDQQVYIPALGFTRPLTNEEIAIGTATYMVVAVEVLAPGDTDILYIAQIRGM